jgi:hypothetical protein
VHQVQLPSRTSARPRNVLKEVLEVYRLRSRLGLGFRLGGRRRAVLEIASIRLLLLDKRCAVRTCKLASRNITYPTDVAFAATVLSLTLLVAARRYQVDGVAELGMCRVVTVCVVGDDNAHASRSQCAESALRAPRAGWRMGLRFPNAEGLELLREDNARTLLSSDLLLAEDGCALRSGDLATERVEAEQSALFQITVDTLHGELTHRGSA